MLSAAERKIGESHGLAGSAIADDQRRLGNRERAGKSFGGAGSLAIHQHDERQLYRAGIGFGFAGLVAPFQQSLFAIDEGIGRLGGGVVVVAPDKTEIEHDAFDLSV